MTNKIQVLIVEDDENLRLTLSDILEDEYDVTTAETIAMASTLTTECTYDIVVLDLMLPDGDGYDFCRQLRNHNIFTPVLMLTARSLEDDLVKGFEVGADDYLTKPYKSNELLARVRALLKRSKGYKQIELKNRTENINGFILDKTARNVTSSQGNIVDLTPKEMDTLIYLYEHPHKAISRQELLDNIWGEVVVDTRTVDNFISSIKKKLNLTTRNSVYIETVRGVGYRLEK